MKKLALSVLALASLLVLSACAPAPTTQQASQQYCQALGAYAQSVAQLHQIDQSSSIDEMKNATIAVQQAYADVIEASAQVREARTADIKAAMNNLSNAVKSVEPSMTVNEARASIQDELAIVEFTISSLNNDVKCSIPTPTPIPSATPVPTPTTSPVTTSQAQLCSDIAAFDTAVTQLQSLSADSTIQQIQDAQTAVAEAWTKVKNSAAQIPEVKIDKLDESVNSLSKAIRDIDASMSFAQAKESISDELLGVQAAREELRTTISCQPSS